MPGLAPSAIDSSIAQSPPVASLVLSNGALEASRVAPDGRFRRD
jgi:hypothetical protein